MTRTTINQKVNVTAVYFQKNNLKTFPRRIELNGDTYTFRDGLSCDIHKDGSLTQIFDMSDGSANYRLRHQADNWTLIAITQS